MLTATYRLLDFKILGDEKGSLIALEANGNISFEMKRVFYIFGSQPNVVRGHHAHKRVEQVIVAVSGACDFILDDGHHRHTLRLDNPAQGLHLSPGIWREFTNFTPDCVLMVLTNEAYDEDEYIRDYDDFLKSVKRLR